MERKIRGIKGGKMVRFGVKMACIGVLVCGRGVCPSFSVNSYSIITSIMLVKYHLAARVETKIDYLCHYEWTSIYLCGWHGRDVLLHESFDFY